MSSLETFQFESHEIRVVGTAANPLWVVSDVCLVLDIDASIAVNGRTRKAKDGSAYHDGGLDDDEKGTAIVSTLGGDQEMLVVNEPGLYTLEDQLRAVAWHLYRHHPEYQTLTNEIYFATAKTR